VKPTPFQKMILGLPESTNLMLVGGRGGGKSGTVKLLILKHCEQYGERAKVLFIRETYKAASEIEDELEMLFKQAYGKKVQHNRQDHVFHLPSGAMVEIGQLERSTDYAKYQGRSYTFLVIDEAGLLKDNKWVTLLKSNLRAPVGIPLREVRAANPGGPQNAYIHQRFICAVNEAEPFQLDGETWVWIASTFRDNPHLDQADYERKLRAACGTNEGKAKAWIDGDWNNYSGAYFGDVLSEKPLTEKGHRLSIKPGDLDLNHHERFIAMDWGDARPSVVYLGLKSRGEWITDTIKVPRGSLIMLDEVNTCVGPDNLNEGKRWPPDKLGEAMFEMCKRWGLRQVPSGVGDDAYGIHQHLLEFLATMRIYLQAPIKGPGSRSGGWIKMRQMLFNALEQNHRPGLWVNDICRYFWWTMPSLARDEDKPEDIDTDGPDHAADAVRYAVMQWGPMTQGRSNTNEPIWNR
jgi:hypothetical protein